MGTPTLYSLSMQFSVDGSVSDELTTKFGVRQATSRLDASSHRIFSINGKDVLIRGAGYSPDLFQRRFAMFFCSVCFVGGLSNPTLLLPCTSSPAQHQRELAYVKDLGLNTIR